MDNKPIVDNILEEPFLRERDVTSENGPSPEEMSNWALNFKRYRRFASLHGASFWVQLILYVVSGPFQSIENRPPISVFTSFYSLIIFTLNATIFPLSSASVSRITLFKSFIIVSVVEFFGLLFNIISVTLCLHSQPMILRSQENDLITTTDVTLYIQSVSVVSLVVCGFGFSLSVAILTIWNRSLNTFIDKTDREKFQNLIELQTHNTRSNK